ncbi:hypothetical protein [Lentibacillus sp. Marseille-P4043]|nr:hypothetical protein [Lentibacillus sp. Marseille-P4043]
MRWNIGRHVGWGYQRECGNFRSCMRTSARKLNHQPVSLNIGA